MKPRGRPKGSQKTNVIGLKKVKPNNPNDGCEQFSELGLAEKERFILSRCVGETIANSVLDGTIDEKRSRK